MESVKLNKLFYQKKEVEQAIKDFSHIGNFSLEEKEGELIIKIKDNKEFPFLKEEFCNYIIGLMKNKTVT